MTQDTKITSEDIVLDYIQEMGRHVESLLDEINKLQDKARAKLKIMKDFLWLSIVSAIPYIFSGYEVFLAMQGACFALIAWNLTAVLLYQKRWGWMLNKADTITQICGELINAEEAHQGHTRDTNE